MTEKEVLLEINHLKAYFPVKRKSMKEEKRSLKQWMIFRLRFIEEKHLGLWANQALENQHLGERF